MKRFLASLAVPIGAAYEADYATRYRRASESRIATNAREIVEAALNVIKESAESRQGAYERALRERDFVESAKEARDRSRYIYLAVLKNRTWLERFLSS